MTINKTLANVAAIERWQMMQGDAGRANSDPEGGVRVPRRSLSGCQVQASFMVPPGPEEPFFGRLLGVLRRVERIGRLRQLIASAIRSKEIAGAVISVSRGGQVLLERAYGDANAYADGKRLDSVSKMTRGHIFDLASMTKAFAATLGAMLLFEEGVLDLDAPVHCYLPEFSRRDDHREIRVDHLLSHRSGLPAWAPLQCLRVQRTQVASYIADLPLERPAGQARCYSDLGYMLLGCVIESIVGEPLDRLLRKRLYGRLGLKTMGFNPKQRRIGPIVATSQGNAFEQTMVERLVKNGAHELAAEFADWRTGLISGEVNDANTFHVFDGVSAHAGLFSDVADLRRLAHFLVDPNGAGEPHIFSQRTLDAFMEPRSSPFGWTSRAGKASLEACEKAAGPLAPRTLYAQGFTGTFAFLEPSTATSVIVLTNRLQMGRRPDGSYARLDELFADIVKLAREL